MSTEGDLRQEVKRNRKHIRKLETRLEEMNSKLDLIVNSLYEKKETFDDALPEHSDIEQMTEESTTASPIRKSHSPTKAASKPPKEASTSPTKRVKQYSPIFSSSTVDPVNTDTSIAPTATKELLSWPEIVKTHMPSGTLSALRGVQRKQIVASTKQFIRSKINNAKTIPDDGVFSNDPEDYFVMVKNTKSPAVHVLWVDEYVERIYSLFNNEGPKTNSSPLKPSKKETIKRATKSLGNNSLSNDDDDIPALNSNKRANEEVGSGSPKKKSKLNLNEENCSSFSTFMKANLKSYRGLSNEEKIECKKSVRAWLQSQLSSKDYQAICSLNGSVSTFRIPKQMEEKLNSYVNSKIFEEAIKK